MKNLPQPLKPLMEQDRWVIWEYTDGKKPPYQSRKPTRLASTADPKTWSSYAEAVAAAPEDGGVGFVIGAGIGALDLDDCRDPDTGALTDWAQELVNKANGAYVEVTPSKRGLRIIGTAEGGTVHAIRQMGVGKVEAYRNTNRYITVSGDQLGKCVKLGSIDALIGEKDTSSSALFHKEVCERGQKGWSVDRIEQHMRDNPKLYKHTKAAQYDSERRLRGEIEALFLKNAGITVREAPKGYTLASLERREFAPLRYYVEDMVVEGLTLIAGRPKKGKSWLLFGMGIDIANGDDALGKLTSRQSAVVYYALEDNPRRMQRRAKILLGKDAVWPKNFHIYHDLAKTDAGGLEQIRQHVKEHEAKVVMIDTMTPIRPRAPKGVDPYQHDYDVISSLQKFAHELRIAIVVTYHTRKAAADDAQESILGSTGITGAVDSWFVLLSNAQGKELHGSGRDIEDVEWGLDPGLNWRWTITGPAWQARKSQRRRDVLELLEQGEMHVNDIAEELHRPVRATTKLLHDMAHDGDIVRKSKGVYVRK